MNRLPLFEQARLECQILQSKFPQLVTLQSILSQLNYLISVESGRSTDRSRLSEIILGVQAAREIEPLHDGVADKLYRVGEEIKAMKVSASIAG